MATKNEELPPPQSSSAVVASSAAAPSAPATKDSGYDQWLQRLLTTNLALRQSSDPKVSQFLTAFFNQIQSYHTTTSSEGGQNNNNTILACRGQQRHLVEACAPRKANYSYARWYDFVQVSDKPRRSGPLQKGGPQGRRFETISIKIQASRHNYKFGMTDDTGYLFPCLQHYVPRACFVVVDYASHGSGEDSNPNIFILHGNKKFAGQGDEGEEEGTASTDTHNPPPKCFPNTAHLKPSYYIFTWKANGKNAGVFGYTDSASKTWLFVNSKGACECVGLLEDVVQVVGATNTRNLHWSDLVRSELEKAGDNNSNTVLLPNIYKSFCEIWNHPTTNRNLLQKAWNQHYLLLFEFCDNKHVVLEYGCNNVPSDHLAFIGLVKQLPSSTITTTTEEEIQSRSIDTYNTGLQYQVGASIEEEEEDTDNNLKSGNSCMFCFDWWHEKVRAPAYTSKPTIHVHAQHLQQATKELMKGTLFYQRKEKKKTEQQESAEEPQEQQWFDPNKHHHHHQQPQAEEEGEREFLSGEGAVCYEMAKRENENDNDKEEVTIRQLFKAKTASYITHRQFREFLNRTFRPTKNNNKGSKKDDVPYFDSMAFHKLVHKLCRQKFGDLSGGGYPDISEFCSHPTEIVVEAAALYYGQLGMWLQTMAMAWNTTVPALVSNIHPDIHLDLSSQAGKDYQELATKIGLPTSTSGGTAVVRCGIAFRIAEFEQYYDLRHSNVFDSPMETQKQILAIQGGAGSGSSPSSGVIPRGYEGKIRIGHQHFSFPQGDGSSATIIKANSDMTAEEKRAKKKQKKMMKQSGNKGGPSVLAPFYQSFRVFLHANPKVKVTIGSRNDDPTLFVLLPKPEQQQQGKGKKNKADQQAAATPLCSGSTITEFQEALLKLPPLDKPEITAEQVENNKSKRQSSTRKSRFLTQEAAVAQAVNVLQASFPSVEDLFQQPAPKDLTFGDVTGRLVRIHSASSPPPKGAGKGEQQQQQQRHLLILRGFSGLGKSTIAKALQRIFGGGGKEGSVRIIETDSFFGPHCPFHVDLLSVAHEDALCRAQEALTTEAAKLVVIANTNTAAWEYAPYIRAAQEASVSSGSLVPIAVLTLDTTVPISDLDNLHDVPEKTVEDMAMRLRNKDNNPENKSIETILEIAYQQNSSRGNQDPALVWSLLGSSGIAALDDIWQAFLQFAAFENISLSVDSIVRPTNPHVTQLYVRSSSTKEEKAKVLALYDKHGAQQMISIGEIRYRVAVQENGEPSKFVNMAVAVESLSPDLVPDLPTPHITIAFDTEQAKAVDSNNLWSTGSDDGPTNDGTQVQQVFQRTPKIGQFEGILEVGTYRREHIVHRLPPWMK